MKGRIAAAKGPTSFEAVVAGVGDPQQRRLQAGQIGPLAGKADDRIVSARVGDDLGEHLAAGGVDDVPVRAFQRRQKDLLAVRRDRHPIAAALVSPLPQQLLTGQVQAHQLLDRADIQPAGGGTGANALHVERLALVIDPRCGNPPHELVPGIDVEHQQAVPAVFQIIAHAGHRHVQPAMIGGAGECR